MYRIKSIIALVVMIMLFNCKDKADNTQNESPIKIEIDSSATKTMDTTDADSQNPSNERKYPYLTDKNAMEFFLQYEKEHKENKVRIVTDFGNIDILLFEETKFHRANFIFLAKQNYFEHTQFYRVIENYIIQGGSTDDQDVMDRRGGIGKYLLPTDTKRGFHHDRGVISMPSGDRDNPYKLASPYEFFIMLRDVHDLDGDYTIFGRVIDGMDVADKIASVKTDDGDWPLKNVYIKRIEVLE